MARHITKPTTVQAAGNMPKKIEEFIGRINSGTEDTSVARMSSPQGWIEPGQTPDFDEYTVVLFGSLRVETLDGVFVVQPGEAIVVPRGEWVRYSTPDGPAQYISICLPAFAPELVHRDE
jgi:mannose-6-phosphate isomerase-like protein (cupin superfamily)